MTAREGGDVEMETDGSDGPTSQETQGLQVTPETRRESWDQSCLGASERAPPANTSILDFWPLEL